MSLLGGWLNIHKNNAWNHQPIISLFYLCKSWCRTTFPAHKSSNALPVDEILLPQQGQSETTCRKRFGTKPCFDRHRGVLVTQSIISISISFYIAFWGISGASQQLVLYKLFQHGCSIRMFWHVFCSSNPNRLFYKSGTPTIWRFAIDNDPCLTLSALIMWKSSNN